MVSAGELSLIFDARILSEYGEVLRRPTFKFDVARVEALLGYVEYRGHAVASSPLPHALLDPDDEPFPEAAIAGKSECLVTGNQAHFPDRLYRGVRVLSPGEFLSFYQKKQSRGCAGSEKGERV
jgi:predicted nucleic acid-binding protein